MSAQQVRLYKQTMKHAEDALNVGDFREAIRFAEIAKVYAHTRVLVAKALQTKGIALRLNGQYQDAAGTFEAATELTASPADDELRGRIFRDLAMVSIDLLEKQPRFGPLTKKYSEAAHEALNISELLLSENEIERAVTLGFKGRLEHVLGNKAVAVALYMEADELLQRSGNRTYELNNLIWLMRLAPRKMYYQRALRLIHETGQTRRKKEAMLIHYGGGDWLYRLVRKLYDKRRRT